MGKLRAWFGWMQESNRFKHFIAGLLAAALCGIGAAITADIATSIRIGVMPARRVAFLGFSRATMALIGWT